MWTVQIGQLKFSRCTFHTHLTDSFISEEVNSEMVESVNMLLRIFSFFLAI